MVPIVAVVDHYRYTIEDSYACPSFHPCFPRADFPTVEIFLFAPPAKQRPPAGASRNDDDDDDVPGESQNSLPSFPAWTGVARGSYVLCGGWWNEAQAEIMRVRQTHNIIPLL